MFRRVSSVAATSVVAARFAGTAAAAAPVASNAGFVSTVRSDFHANVETGKYVAKIAFNPYAAGFMEALEKKSLAAQPGSSNVDNQFQFCQHTGSFVTASW